MIGKVPDEKVSKKAWNHSNRFLHPSHHDIRHFDKLKLPNGILIVPMSGNHNFEVGDMVFMPYWVLFLLDVAKSSLYFVNKVKTSFMIKELPKAPNMLWLHVTYIFGHSCCVLLLFKIRKRLPLFISSGSTCSFRWRVGQYLGTFLLNTMAVKRLNYNLLLIWNILPEWARLDWTDWNIKEKEPRASFHWKSE